MGIVDLLTLASNRACGVISQQLVCRPEPEDIPNLVEGKLGRRTVMYKPFADLFARRIVTATPDDREIDFQDFLFTCRDIPFEDLVVRWLTLRKEIVRATNMVFSLHYSKPTFVQTQVLVAAVSAEALSRCLHPPARKTYKERLLDIAATPPQAIVGKIIPDVEAWANELKSVRNGLAHGLEDQGQNANLFLLLQRTKYLIYLVLMGEIGLPEAILDRAVEANQYLRYLHREQP